MMEFYLTRIDGLGIHEKLLIFSRLITILVLDVKRDDGEATEDEAESINSYLTPGIADPPKLRLAHFSIREYLISGDLRHGHNRLSFYHSNKKTADRSIAKTCPAYLLQLPCCIDSDTEESHPLQLR